MLAYPQMNVSKSESHDQQSASWVTGLELLNQSQLRGFERIGCGTCAAACFPDASQAVVQLAADQISFLFLFDDLYPEGTFRLDPNGLRAALRPYADLVSGRPGAVMPATAYARALNDLVQRAVASAPAFWRARYAKSFEAYCEGCVLEAEARLEGVAPSLQAYLEVRRGSIGMSPMFDLMELTHGVFLTDEEFETPVVTRLRELGADLSALVNDLSSLEKEEAVGDVCNAVIVLQASLGCGRNEALDAVATLHNTLLAELETLEKQLGNTRHGSAMALYARSIRQWVHGHYGWILSSRRYAPARSIAA